MSAAASEKLHDILTLARQTGEAASLTAEPAAYTPPPVSAGRDAIVLDDNGVSELMERMKETLKHQLEMIRQGVEQQIAMLKASSQEEGATLALDELQAQCSNIDAALASVNGAANLSQLASASYTLPNLSSSVSNSRDFASNVGTVDKGTLMAEITIEKIQTMSFEAMSSSFGVYEYAQMSTAQLASVQAKLDKGYDNYDKFNREMQSEIEATAAANGVDISKEIEKQKELEQKEKEAKTKQELAKVQVEQARNQLEMGEKAGLPQEKLTELRKELTAAEARYDEQREKDIGEDLGKQLEGKSAAEKKDIRDRHLANNIEARETAQRDFAEATGVTTEAEKIQKEINYNNFRRESQISAYENDVSVYSNNTSKNTGFDLTSYYSYLEETSKTQVAGRSQQKPAGSTTPAIPESFKEALAACGDTGQITLAEEQPEFDGETQNPCKSPNNAKQNLSLTPST